MPRIVAPSLRTTRTRRRKHSSVALRFRVRDNPSLALPLGENDLALELPGTFPLDAQRVFNAYLDLCKQGVVLERECAAAHHGKHPWTCREHGPRARDLAARIAWLCGMYLALAELACDDWDDHGRDEAIETLWGAAGKMAVAADASTRRNPTPEITFSATPDLIMHLRNAPDVKTLLRERAEGRMRLEITAVTRALIPGLDDSIANAMLRGNQGPCEILGYWARVRGAEDAEVAWKGGYAPATAREATEHLSSTELGELVRARLGIELSRMELSQLAEIYNGAYETRVGILAESA